MLPEARRAWLEATEKFPGNPSSPHRLGARAEAALGEARESLASRLGCHESEIVFTSGATESNNTVLHHYARTGAAEGEVWVSALEHPCVLDPARFYFGPRLKVIPATQDGIADLNWLEDQLSRQRPALVALMAANNETGALQPWRAAQALCRPREVPFFCDAAQWIGKLPAGDLGVCDWLSGAAHKFGGPRGVGFLKVPSTLALTPLLRGGPQEETRRAGTENVAGVLAMLAALEWRTQQIGRGDFVALGTGRDDFEQGLLTALPGCAIAAVRSPRLWNTVSALMPEADGQPRWVVKLDKLGFAVSTGSACSSGKEQPSPVLLAMGHTAAQAGRALRFSAGWDTTMEDWNVLLAALKSVPGTIPAARQKVLENGVEPG